MPAIIFFIISSIFMIFNPLSISLMAGYDIISFLSFMSIPILIATTEHTQKTKFILSYIAIPTSVCISELAYNLITSGKLLYIKEQNMLFAILFIFLFLVAADAMKSNKNDIIYFIILGLIIAFFAKIDNGIIVMLYAGMYFIYVSKKETYSKRILPAILISIIVMLIFIIMGTINNNVEIEHKITNIGFVNYIIEYTKIFLQEMIKYANKKICQILGFVLSAFIVAIPIKYDKSEKEEYMSFIPYLIYAISMFVFVFIQYK